MNELMEQYGQIEWERLEAQETEAEGEDRE